MDHLTQLAKEVLSDYQKKFPEIEQSNWSSWTKENFFNELKEKYPLAMDFFCQWIDKMKQKIHWYDYVGQDVKFHDLPAPFQIGFMVLFMNELENRDKGTDRVIGLTCQKVSNDFPLYLKSLNKDIEFIQSGLGLFSETAKDMWQPPKV